MNTKIYHSLYTLFVAGALLVSGCSNDDDTYDFYAAHPDAVRFHITADGTPQTRVNTEGDGSSFDPADQIAISADNGASYSTYVQSSGDDWVPAAGQSYLRWKEEKLSFQAYYPVTEGTDYTHFTVPYDQELPDNLRKADYMTAEAIGQSPQTPVALAFKHQLAKVTVSITMNEELTGETVTAILFCTRGHTLVNGSLTDGDEEAAYSPCFTNDKYMAILPPQSGSKFRFIQLRLSNTAEYNLMGIPELKPGKAYTLALQVGHDGVKLVRDITVAEWGKTETMPEGTATLKPEYYSWYTTNPDAETFTLSTADELRAFAKLVNGDPEVLAATIAAGPVSFEGKTVQIADTVTTLDLSGTQWTPIGTNLNVAFKGTFDGKGKEIKGLTITASSGENFGLFGVMNGDAALVKNVRLTDVNIACENSSFIGGIGGKLYGSVSSCYVSGTIAGKSSIGGIFGILGSSNHSITDCYTAGSITGTTSSQCEIGCIVGSNHGKIENCYSTANVTTTGNSAGGIVGINSGSINHCYSTGTVSGTLRIGGIAGTCWNDPKITGCIALNAEVKATDTGDMRFGRISGALEFSDPITGIIENCHASEGMKVYHGSALQPINDGAVDNINGADLDATACLTTATYTGIGWSTDHWVFDNNTQMQSLPWLQVFDTWTWENVADYRPTVPAHLVQVP